MMKTNKLIYLLLFLMFCSLSFGMEDASITYSKNGQDLEYVITKNATLLRIAQTVNMPVKSLKLSLSDVFDQYKLNNPDFAGHPTQDRVWDNLSLEELQVSPATIAKLHDEFVGRVLNYGGSVTLAGMSIVFISLLLISVIVSRLQYLGKRSSKKTDSKEKGKTKTVKTPIGNVTGSTDGMSANAIVAVITALHKHKSSVEERVKIQMTFSRTPVNMWSASAKLSMPNKIYNKSIERNK